MYRKGIESEDGETGLDNDSREQLFLFQGIRFQHLRVQKTFPNAVKFWKHGWTWVRTFPPEMTKTRLSHTLVQIFHQSIDESVPSSLNCSHLWLAYHQQIPVQTHFKARSEKVGVPPSSSSGRPALGSWVTSKQTNCSETAMWWGSQTSHTKGMHGEALRLQEERKWGKRYVSGPNKVRPYCT